MTLTPARPMVSFPCHRKTYGDWFVGPDEGNDIGADEWVGVAADADLGMLIDGELVDGLGAAAGG